MFLFILKHFLVYLEAFSHPNLPGLSGSLLFSLKPYREHHQEAESLQKIKSNKKKKRIKTNLSLKRFLIMLKRFLIILDAFLIMLYASPFVFDAFPYYF